MEYNKTLHYADDRQIRERFIMETLGGDGNPVATIYVDNNHKNGLEVHTLTDHGVIIIRNKRTHKLITKLIARPNQMKKFFTHGEVPSWLWQIGLKHAQKGYNHV